MQIKMSEQVFQWYKEELSLTKGDHIRFYIRYGGLNSFVKGFSLGYGERYASRNPNTH